MAAKTGHHDSVGRCPGCRSVSVIKRRQGGYACQYCSLVFGQPYVVARRAVSGSGVIAPLTYRQQLVRERLKALEKKA